MDKVDEDEAVELATNALHTAKMQRCKLKVRDRVLRDMYDAIGIWRVGTVKAIADNGTLTISFDKLHVGEWKGAKGASKPPRKEGFVLAKTEKVESRVHGRVRTRPLVGFGDQAVQLRLLSWPV
jgi:hypothetical protein